MLIIFDCDGVLIDSERLLNDVFRECLADIGLEITLEEVIAEYKGYSIAHCLKLVERRMGKSFDHQAVSDQYEKMGAKALQENIRPIPGITEALEQLPYRSCVASGSSHEHIRLGLSGAGIIHHFEGVIFSASDVAIGKPAPDLFLYTAETMSASPDDCIVIEDSPAGVQAAVSAGMKVLGFADLTPEEELREAGAQTFTSMYELPELIKSLA